MLPNKVTWEQVLKLFSTEPAHVVFTSGEKYGVKQMQKNLIILGTVNKQEFPDVTVLRLSEAQLGSFLNVTDWG